MKKIEDYLPLYIGCQVMTPDGEAKLLGISGGVFGIDKADVHFGSKMIKTKSSCDGGYNKTRNHGSYMIKAQSLVAIATTDPDFNEIDLPGGVVPILRPLDSMTEEEAIELLCLTVPTTYVDVKKGGIAYGTEEAGVEYLFFASIDASRFKWLLSKGFDLFGLIPDGLALNRNTI